MKYLIYFFAIILLLGLNLGLFNHLQIKGQIPNFLFLMSLCFVLEKKDYDFFFISFISGLFLDFYSTSFFGSFTFAFLIISLCVYFFVNYITVVEANWKSLSLGLIICFFILNLLVGLYGIAVFKFGWTASAASFKIFKDNFFPGLFYNWLFLYPVYLYANFLKTFVDKLSIRRRGVIR